MSVVLLLVVAVLLGGVLGDLLGQGLARADISAYQAEIAAAHEEADRHRDSASFWHAVADRNADEIGAQRCFHAQAVAHAASYANRLGHLLHPDPDDIPAMEAGAWD